MKKLSFLLLLLISMLSAEAAFITGKYIGNGASTKAITGLCFHPEVVMITGNSSQHAWVATSTMPAGYAKDLTLSDPLKTGYISSLDAGGFTVGSSTHANAPGVTYYYTAWDDADGSISVGSFTPNGCGPDWATDSWYGFGSLVKYGSSNYKVIAPYGIYSNTIPSSDPTNWQSQGACTAFNTNITTGSRPKMVWVFSEGANWDNNASAQFVFDGPNAANPAGFTSGGYLAGEEKIINGLNSTGFSVTPVVQAGTHNGTANGTRYNYVAFTPSSTTAAGTYTGTAVDNLAITAIAGQFVITKPLTNATGNPWFKACTMGTDSSFSFAGVSSVMNIKNFTSTGFTVGYSGEVNGNGGAYEYFAMGGGFCNTSLPTISVSPSPAITGAQLTASGTNTATYAWSPATGLSSTTGSVVTASPGSTTIYTITATSPLGCTATTKDTVNAAPCTITMSHDTTTCIGANTTISVTPSGSSNYVYAWTPTTGLSSSSIANPVASPSVSTTYKVKVTGDGGCNKTDSVKITISQLQWSELNGVSFNCETLSKTNPDGYTNGSAFSKNHMNPHQNGWVEFTVGNTDHEHYGLALRNYSAYNTDIRYGFQVTGNNIYLIQKGVFNASVGVATGDKLKVERIDSTINYYKNGTLLSSIIATTSAERLFIDVSLYYSGHSVKVATSFTRKFDVNATINDNNPGAAGRDGSISLEALNAVGSVSYSWSSGATTATISNLSAGTYTVTASDATGQSATRSFTLLNKAVWTKLVNMTETTDARLTKTNPAGQLEGAGISKVYLPANQDGYIEYFATDRGGGPNFYFGFSSLPTNFDIQYYSEQDINYCFLWYGYGSYIREGGQYIQPTGVAEATSTLRISREGSYIVYYIDGVEQRRTATNPNRDLFLKFQQDAQLPQGIIRTSFGGGITSSYEVTDNNPVSTADGSITTEAMGGVAPYTYSWSTGATTANISNLLPGQYTLTVTDAANHSNTKTFKVMNKVAWKNLSGMTLQANDRLKKTATGYDFTSGWGSSKNYLPAGQDGEITLELTRSSNNAYIGFSAHPMLFIPDYTHNMINYGLNTNSNYFLLSEGGRTVYNNGSSKNGGTEFKIARVTNPTTHVTEIVYYIDAEEVRRVVTSVQQDLFIVFSQSADGVDLGKVRASFGHELQASYEPITDNDPLQTPGGAITAEGVGGKAPYTYLWNTGATTTTINNLAPGDYTLVLTDANNQTASKTFTVMNKASWTKMQNVQMQSNGFLKQSSYAHDAMAQSVNFIPSGVEGAFEYISAGPGALYLGLSQHPFAYYDDSRISDITYGWFLWNYTMGVFQQYFTYNDGLLSQGGNLFRIERKINTSTNQPEIIYFINHLEVARYVVETMDQDLYLKFDMQGGAFGQFRLSHGHQLNASALISNRNIDAANGALDITPFGGKAPYSYQWSNGQTTQDISGLKKGNYILTITDANGATKTKTFAVKNEISWAHTNNFSVEYKLIKESAAPSYATSKNFIEAGQDGKVEFEFFGNYPGYFGLSTTDNISNYHDIKYGYYQWQSYLSLADGGNMSGWMQLPSPHGSYFHNGDVVSLERVGNTLYYKIDGLLITSKTVPATERLYIAIHNPDAAGRSLNVLSDFNTGKYSPSKTDVICYGQYNGKAEIENVDNNLYKWSPEPPVGQGTSTIDNLWAGIWKVNLLDTLTHNRDSVSFEITQPTKINIHTVATRPTCISCSDGQISINLTGGKSPYSYSIDSCGTLSSNHVFTSLASTNYSICAHDSTQCEVDSAVALMATNTNPPFANLTSDPNGTLGLIDDNVLRFIYREAYEIPIGKSLAYKIYNSANVLLLDPSTYLLSIRTGNNKIEIPCMSNYLINKKYYTLEVTNDKQEKFYLPFYMFSDSSCN